MEVVAEAVSSTDTVLVSVVAPVRVTSMVSSLPSSTVSVRVSIAMVPLATPVAIVRVRSGAGV